MPKVRRAEGGGGAVTVLDKIVAVITSLATPGGCSRAALAKGLAARFDVTNAACVKAALAKGVASRLLTQEGQRFWITASPPPPPPAEASVGVEDVVVGAGAEAAEGSRCTMSYTGRLAGSGAQFDAAPRFTFTLGGGEVIKGWDAGVAGMRVGGSRVLRVPSKLGYGKRGSSPEIPPDADLVFDVKLLSVA